MLYWVTYYLPDASFASHVICRSQKDANFFVRIRETVLGNWGPPGLSLNALLVHTKHGVPGKVRPLVTCSPWYLAVFDIVFEMHVTFLGYSADVLKIDDVIQSFKTFIVDLDTYIISSFQGLI